METEESANRTISRIMALIAEVAADQKPYADRICPRCPSPCCLRVHYVYSRDDLRFLRLIGKKPVWTGKGFLSDGCWFLGAGGCRLEPEIRPMLCHRYLCDDLRNEMMKRDPQLIAALYSKFNRIEKLRQQMLADRL